MLNAIRDAISDLGDGLRLHRVWMALANEDVGDQHRRTTLGPLWLLINYLAFAAVFIFVFRAGGSVPLYPAYVATGLLVWFHLMESVTQAVSLFPREESFIKGTTLPLSVYVLRQAMQAAIRGGYALLGCAIILVLSGAAPGAGWLGAGFGLLVVLAVTPAFIVMFALLGAWFPDSQFIVSNLMRVGMFLTPVFWSHEGAGGLRAVLYYWNPFTYFLEIVRQPILTGAMPWPELGACLAIGAAAWLLALLLLGRFRREVVFLL